MNLDLNKNLTQARAFSEGMPLASPAGIGRNIEQGTFNIQHAQSVNNKISNQG